MIARHLRPLLFSLVLFPCIPAHAANLIVVEARGIPMRVGGTVDSTKPITLKAGQHVTLINDAGTTLKLDGPYDRAPDADQARGLNLSAMVAALGTERRARVGEPGTTRGLAPNALPEPWLLDASQTGTVCLQEGTMAVLWRPKSDTDSTLSLMPSDKSWKADAKWPRGADRITMSTQVPIHGGATYIVVLDGTQSSLTVSNVPAVLSNDQMRGAWMAQRGCVSQAEALLRR
jgi:hypothetical protein